MNLSTDKRSPVRGQQQQPAGAGVLGGHTNTAPAHPHYTVGEVGFGRSWSCEDSMAASIVRLQGQLDEANAQIALLEQEQKILVEQREEARVESVIFEREIRRLREEVAKYRASRLTDEDDYVQLTDKGRALLEGLR